MQPNFGLQVSLTWQCFEESDIPSINIKSIPGRGYLFVRLVNLPKKLVFSTTLVHDMICTEEDIQRPFTLHKVCQNCSRLTMEQSDETPREEQKWSTLEMLLRNAGSWCDQAIHLESVEGPKPLRDTAQKITIEHFKKLHCFLETFLDLKTSTTSKQYFVKGVVSGHSIEALPDSGANMSLISNTLASKLGLDPKPGTEKTIYLANKKAVRSPGMVTVPWKFDGESGMYPLDCWILPKSIHTIVLGKPFLNATQTLKALASRIKCKIVNGPRRLRLHLLGGESENEKVWGYLNDRFTTAFPDTGSDVMLISRKYAEELELDMDTRVEDRVEVEFPDGSTAWTSGIIRDALWRIGSKTTNCDFYVLDELCVDVVLSNEYLFNENVFSECDIYFFDAELDVAGDFSSSFCNIRLIGRYGGNLNSLEEEYLEDCK